MVRFDARRRRPSNDGDDFRDFVGELLRASQGFGRPTPRDSGSVDGGIDLYCGQTGLVVECKFVSANAKDESSRIDQEWKNTRDKFDTILESCDGKAAPTRSPYLPWGDPKQPIRRYILATCGRLANEQRQRQLADDIGRFFKDEISSRPGYEHLYDLTVEVMDWTNIETRLVDHPALIFRWLRQWPSGFSELDEGSPSGFRAFFYDEKLPYLGRDSWQPPPGLRHPWTETNLVEELSAAEVRDPVVVLVGQGGVGKTRLALELARRMRNAGWWALRCDGLRATAVGLRQLLGESSKPARLLLFADYLETWANFEAFTNDVLDLNESSGHKIRIVATCRASYRDRLSSSVNVRTVGGSTSIEVAYSKAVTSHILRAIGPGEGGALAEKCRFNFALAAFLFFLRQERPESFASEVSALREEPSFEHWVVRRLHNAGLRDLQPTAAILSACDFPAMAFDHIAKAHSADPEQLRRVLVADKWIERREAADSGLDGPSWGVFHDVFADVVLGRALETAPERDDAIDRLLDRAVANDVLRQTLNSLQRLKQADIVSAVDWRLRLIEVERRHPGTLARHAATVLRNALPTPQMRIDLIASNAGLRDAIASDAACDIGIALTATAWVETKSGEPDGDKFDRIVLPLLDIAVSRGHRSNMVLRLAFAASPTRYRGAALQWINSRPSDFQTHFLLKAWLDHSVAELKSGAPEGAEHLEAVSASVERWLAAMGRIAHASFILRPWLDAASAIGGERAAAMVAKVEVHVAAWLAHEEHATSDDAQFVYKSWLDAASAIGGERAAAMVAKVEAHVATWLVHEQNATSDVARFVYGAWLDAASAIGDERAVAMVAKVGADVAAWLAHGEHATSDVAQFVYKSWLDAASAIGGERAVAMVAKVGADVAAWLAHGEHATSDVAQFVYKSWLDAASAIGGERAAAMVAKVEAHVATWLVHEQNATSDVARFVYGAWLDAASAIGDERAVAMVAKVGADVAAWLAHGEHATSDVAQFVYKSWLDAASAIGGERAVAMVAKVGADVAAWLAHGEHATSVDAQFVYKGWLDAASAIGGERAAAMVAKVEAHVATWLVHEQNATSGDACFLYKSWLEAVDEKQARRFLKEALAWIKANQDHDACDFVLESWLDKRLDFGSVAEPCFRAVRRLADHPNGAFILKHVVRQRNLPDDVVVAALGWCARFPYHEDALYRLGPLLAPEVAVVVGAGEMVRVTARVLHHLDLEATLDNPSGRLVARATLGSLFLLGEHFPRAEKLARIYFVRWLKDGRVFQPTGSDKLGEEDHPIFDQKLLLAEALLTVMAHGEFSPAVVPNDETVLARFCEWVGQWQQPHKRAIADLVEELTDYFGCAHVWQRMLSR